MQFVVHPARRQPLKTLGVVLYLALMAWGLGASLLAPMLSISAGAAAFVVFVALLMPLRAWFLPTRYRIDDDGIEVGGWRTRRFSWNRFRAWRRERNGVYLSPFSDTSRFDNFRGLFIVLGNFVVSPSPPNLETLLEEKIGGPAAARA